MCTPHLGSDSYAFGAFEPLYGGTHDVYPFAPSIPQRSAIVDRAATPRTLVHTSAAGPSRVSEHAMVSARTFRHQMLLLHGIIAILTRVSISYKLQQG